MKPLWNFARSGILKSSGSNLCKNGYVCYATCPHPSAALAADGALDEWHNALPYSKVPGPRPIPILGNTWRLLTGIRKVVVQDAEFDDRALQYVEEIFRERTRESMQNVKRAEEGGEESDPVEKRCRGPMPHKGLKKLQRDIQSYSYVCLRSLDLSLYLPMYVRHQEDENITEMAERRFKLFPIVGQYTISDIGKISFLLHKEYGRIVRFSGLMGRPDLLFIFDADEIERCYRNEGTTPFRPSVPSLVEYKSVVRKDFFGDLPGVVGVHGEQWREFRSRVQKPILQLSTVRRYLAPLEEVTDDFLRRCMELLDENSELPDDFDNEIHKWSLECIGRVALDTRLGCLEPNLPADSEPQQIINAAKYALRNVAILELKAPYWRYFPTPLWTKYVNNMNFFVEVCMKYIRDATERMKTKERGQNGEPSLLEKVLTSEKNEKIASVMALDLMLVGIDTISMAVCSILYQLATRPEQQKKVHEELVRILPDPSTPLSISLLDQMHYLKAFIKEVFRIYSTVIGNGRTLQEDTVICGYQIPKGIQVVFPTLVTGNMEENVSDASSFRPERWLKANQGGFEGKLHPFSSLPYGYGARMCLGKRFADLEMQILLAKLLRNYKLEYNHEPLEYAVTFMYAPDGPLKFKMTKI